MECLNTDNNAASNRGNLGKKKRAVGQKPASLAPENLKKPSSSMTVTNAEKENTKAQPAAAAQQQAAQDNDDSSDVDLGCLACGS